MRIYSIYEMSLIFNIFTAGIFIAINMINMIYNNAESQMKLKCLYSKVVANNINISSFI